MHFACEPLWPAALSIRMHIISRNAPVALDEHNANVDHHVFPCQARRERQYLGFHFFFALAVIPRRRRRGFLAYVHNTTAQQILVISAA